ncbi:MAG: hypothetical protein ACOWWR_11115 [Eubacteriales bacterium]
MSIRKFIFFEEIDNGYSVDHKEIKGHIRIIQRDNALKLTLFIENLRSGEYVVYGMNVGDYVVKVGSFSAIDKLEKNMEYNGGLGDLQGIIICPYFVKDKIIACAWLKNDHENISKIRNKIIKSENNSEKKPDTTEKEYIDIQEQDTAVDNKQNTVKEVLHKKYKEILNKPNEFDQKSMIEDDIINANILNNPKYDGENKIDENEKNREDSRFQNEGIYNNQIFYLWKNIDKLEIKLERVEPFYEKIPHHQWWKINENNIDIQYYCILYNGYLMPMIYPFMNYKNILKESNDWIFGVVTEKFNHNDIYKYFVYGIPGRFYMQEQPFKGSTGYLYWQSRNIEKNDPFGYWLLYVDVHTGKIVIPRRPVKPPLNKNIIHNNM